MAKNKVKFNLKNAHWARVTFDDQDNATFGTPKPWPGSVSLALDPQGDVSPFYADGIIYWRSAANNGYEGDFETALVPEDFRLEILKEQRDANGVLIENANVETEHFALLYEVDGDQKGRRNVLFNCTVTRPSMGGSTIESSKEPETDTVTITASPMPKSEAVKATTGDEVAQDTFDTWFNSVYYHPEIQGSALLTGLTIGTLVLTPQFDQMITVYTATTTNASDAVTATGDTGATVKILLNGTEIESGDPAAWQVGENTLAIVVQNGTAQKSYTVLVTKE